ncbi:MULTISPECIES: metallophosphoesterase [Winogradskyella]|uniref:metallophosphoesterase n=1 Tax=Winogradskyella TaxID=286104 RepID=UPI0015C9062E|nr:MULTISPECIES: metallophosphoesterase [Winogradskyella]QXP78839.1 metallophosphoesterase [Winogradskyella sp. HaHa_3_26]
MKKRIFRYLKHIIVTLLIVIPLFVIIGFLSGNTLKHSRNDLADNWNDEGPYVFFKNDSLLSINYIKGDRKNGFELETKTSKVDSSVDLKCYYPLDSTSFNFVANTNFEVPASIYSDSLKILAISDIESNYKTFRNFLINSAVIDQELNWTFGKNHLVLVGDFIDRSYFTTQVLWFIYKLEQDAKSKGGNVHYILGNHEIMNMQGDHSYSKSKYNHVASILGKKQFEFYDKNSFIGRWLKSKNTIELINGNLFVHGGISPKLENTELNIDELNQLIRENYYKPYFPKKNGEKTQELLTSSITSPYWYRGYFKNDLSQEEIDIVLNKFNAKAVIVGHTIQSKVNRTYNGKVIGIDVKHPQDYYEYFPTITSEGLLIKNGKYYRVFENGETEEMK